VKGNWDWGFALEVFPDLLRGLGTTIQVTFAASIIAILLGLVFAIIRRLQIPGVSLLVTLLVQFLRSTPLLVQAYFAFYALPHYGPSFSPFATGVVVLGLNYAAYIAEVYRAGIESVPAGQWEAATALSLPTRRIWQRIVLPQAIVAVIPALGNYVIAMFKDSAVLYAITVFELLAHATAAGSSSFRYLEPITIAGILYLAVSCPSAWLIQRLEKRLVRT
jgi:polar amino acid transport system permease protein